MKIVCLKCKNEDIEIRYERPFEEHLSVVLPFAPYYCEQCDKRLPNLIMPPWTRYRVIFVSSLGVLFLLTVILSFTGGDDDPSEDVKVAEGTAPAAVRIQDGSTMGLSDEEVLKLDEQRLSADAEPDLTTGPPAGSVPVEGEVWSDRVHGQLARNLAVMRGEEVPAKSTQRKRRVSAPPQSASSVAAGSGLIKGIREEKEDGVFHLRILGEIKTYKGFAVGNNKYVVDLPGDWRVAGGIGQITPEHPMVAKVRVGKHSDKFRLVFDLAQPVVGEPAYLVDASGLSIRLTF